MLKDTSAHITFDYDLSSFRLTSEYHISKWLFSVALSEHKNIDKLRYIFCSDRALLQINMDFLQHDDLTDIITFPYQYDPIQAEIFISVERVKENASRLEEPFDRELRRVMVHGLLHMCGYGDKTSAEQKRMRTKENTYLDTFS